MFHLASPSTWSRRVAAMALSALIVTPAMATDLPAPLTDDDFLQFEPAQADLGRLLFYDKILSGNQNISCGTCHHHDLGGTDGLALGIGEGGEGLGTKRVTAAGATQIHARIPRNAPALWNLAYRDLRNMFHDGRLAASDSFASGYDSPAKSALPEGLNSLLAAQALFPITAEHEMSGNPTENPIADAIHGGIPAGWPIIADRVRANPAYAEMFIGAFSHIDSAEDIAIVDIANALAAFEGTEWQNADSPFDKYLAGDINALDAAQTRGMDLFYGEAQCSTCHSGPLLTDQSFHALCVPQFGPGKTLPFDPLKRDIGRMLVTQSMEDAYRFRTPALRNVALTAPYGHNGALPTLEAAVRHHLNPAKSLASWTPEMAALPEVPWLASADFGILQDQIEQDRQLSRLDITPHDLSDTDVADLVAFLNALTGETALQRPLGRPAEVPSGLPVD